MEAPIPWGLLPLGIPAFRRNCLLVILRCLVRPFVHTHRMLVKQKLLGGTFNNSPHLFLGSVQTLFHQGIP